ncbi:HEAT repeat domain-containing protein [Saccharothrix variisporea]|uniref:HEAT repeat domain-containing protein n=1 Tax=Saccharothrix variisporea TaxID=543527 RepID=UPI001FE5B20E|nr:HEAT repeat domain-containing protein [Saccharothrix variisporea]
MGDLVDRLFRRLRTLFGRVPAAAVPARGAAVRDLRATVPARPAVPDLPEGVPDLLLAACHPNGYVREAAVTALGERDDVTALPVLALRAADWVPEVRDRARRVCARWLDRAPAEAIAGLAPAALALQARQEGRWLAQAVGDVLRDGPPEALAAALASEDRRTRRLAYTTGVRTLDVDHLVHAARTDSDLPIRVLCAEAAIRSTGDPEVARRLLTSRTAAVRAEAVRALAAAGDTGPAVEALTDRSALVRATAQVALRRAGTDPATRYRALLADQRPPRPAVIAGLAETGTRADAALLRPWLAHPSSRGRAETVRALRHLGDTPRDLLLPLLTDEVSSVTRQVVQSLEGHTLDEHHLRPLLHPPHPLHVQRAAYRLLCAQGVWTRISVDLELVATPDHALCGTARSDLGEWLRRDAATTYSVPDGPRATELSGLLAEAEPFLSRESTRSLRFCLNLT